MGKVKAHLGGMWSSTNAPVPPPPTSPSPSAPSTVTGWIAPTPQRHLVAPPSSPIPAPDGNDSPPVGAASPSAASQVATDPSSAADAVVDASTVLDHLVDSIGGVRSAMLASVDGFGLARSSTMADEASHPAMLAAAVGLAHQLVVMGRGNALRQLVVDHDAGLMLIWPIGSTRVLAVLAATSVDQRSLRQLVQRCAALLAGPTT